MKPEAARALSPQDDQLILQGDKLEFQRRLAAKMDRERIEWRSCRATVRRSHRKSPSFPNSSEF
jgi:hypothetical protein